MKRAVIILPMLALAGNAGATPAITPDKAPTPAQTAIVVKAVPDQYKSSSFTIGTGDLNSDGKPDLIVQFTDSDWCSPTGKGCAGTVILSTPSGYATHDTPLPMFGAIVNVLTSKHNGLNDLRFDGEGPIFTYDGKSYNNVAR